MELQHLAQSFLLGRSGELGKKLHDCDCDNGFEVWVLPKALEF